MTGALSFATPANDIQPRVGMVIVANLPFKRMPDRGEYPYLVIGISGRYVTLFRVSHMLTVKVKRRLWPLLPMHEQRADASRLLSQLNNAKMGHDACGLKYNAAECERAEAVINSLGRRSK